MLFRDPTRVIEVSQPTKVLEGFRAAEEALADGYFVAGYISYEAGFALETSLAGLSTELPDSTPLLWLGCYRSPEICGESDPDPTTGLATPPMNLRFSLSADDYTHKVEAIRSLIAAGETYQANLTLEVLWRTNEHPAEMYERLLAAQPVPYAALLHPMPGWHVLSLSPELFFARDGERIVTRPMKGTAARGLDLAETRANAAWLQADEKNRAENVMIVDLLRNDLGRICQTGSVQVTDLFSVEQYPTVLQMTSTVEGKLRHGMGYSELFRALFPSGSIVGAPKIHTMRLLHELEKRPRGVYTGAIGYIAPDHVAEFNVAIRTISLRAGEARLGVGSGIVDDSQPALEYAECRTKIAFLTREPEWGFQLIETLLLQRGTYTLLEEHLERMTHSAEYFDMIFDRSREETALEEAAQAHKNEDRTRVRLLLDRQGAVTWTASQIKREDLGPVALLLRPERTDPTDTFLRHKTTRRALYDDAFRQAQAHSYADALFCNVREEITEGAVHSVMVSIDKRWLTPPLASGVLPGVYRRHLLEQGRLSERVLQFKDLPDAEAVYVCNSVRGLRRVRCIQQKPGNTNDAFETVWSDPLLG